MIQKTTILSAALCLLLLTACNDQQEENIVSLGSQMTQEKIEHINNLDKASYAELEGIVKDNSVIDPEGKYLMIIFGANGCTYCEELKKEIKNSSTIQTKLKESFSPYYVNFSYLKPHQFVTGISNRPIMTNDLVKIYRIGPTPTTIFATPEGKTIYIHQGAMNEKQFIIALDFITSQAWQGAQNEQDIAQRFKTFLQERS